MKLWLYRKISQMQYFRRQGGPYNPNFQSDLTAQEEVNKRNMLESRVSKSYEYRFLLTEDGVTPAEFLTPNILFDIYRQELLELLTLEKVEPVENEDSVENSAKPPKTPIKPGH